MITNLPTATAQAVVACILHNRKAPFWNHIHVEIVKGK